MKGDLLWLNLNDLIRHQFLLYINFMFRDRFVHVDGDCSSRVFNAECSATGPFQRILVITAGMFEILCRCKQRLVKEKTGIIFGSMN